MDNSTDSTALTIDLDRRQVLRGSELVKITARAFELLSFLASQPDRLFTNAEILESVWPNTVVTPGLVKDYIAVLRKALNDDAHNPHIIKTERGRGYQFIGSGLLRTIRSGKETFIPLTTSLTIVVNHRFQCRLQNCEQFAARISADLLRFNDIRILHPDSSEMADYRLEFCLLSAGLSEQIGITVTCQASLEVVLSDTADLIDFASVMDVVNYCRTVTINVHAALGRAVCLRPFSSRAMTTETDLLLHAECLKRQPGVPASSVRAAFEAALEFNPSSNRAMIGLAQYHIVAASQQLGGDYYEEAHTALELAARAYALDRTDSRSTWVFGNTLSLVGDYDTAGSLFRRSLRMNPCDTDAIVTYGYHLCQIGKPEPARQCIEYALKLDPAPPGWHYWILACAFFQLRQYDSARQYFNFFIYQESSLVRPWYGLASTYALLGDSDGAQELLERIRQSEPNIDLSTEYDYHAAMNQNETDVDHWMSGLVKAGL